MAKCLLIDGNSIIYRAFFALPPLTNSSGLHTNAVYGFTTMLLKLLEEERPTHVLVAFDAGKYTFRHNQYSEYKAGRAKTPPELSEQFPLLKQMLQQLNICSLEMEGYEADDLIGTFSSRAEAQGIEALVISGDKDMLQLASDQVTIGLTRRGITEMETYQPETIWQKYQLTPAQIIDLKGLMGDTSDNIPGIPGVGEKTALKLLHQYGSVEGVLSHVHKIKGKMQQTIQENAELARMSKEIATIFREVPTEVSWDDILYRGLDPAAARESFQKLGFKSLMERIRSADGEGSPTEATSHAALAVTSLRAEELQSLFAHSPQVRSMHVEVVGDNPHVASIAGISLMLEDERIYYISLATLKGDGAPLFRQWLEDEAAKKTIYDAHQAELALSWSGVQLRGVEFDIVLAAYLLDPNESSHTLSDLIHKYGGSSIPEDEEIFGKGAKFKLPEQSLLAEQLGRKAKAIAELKGPLKRALSEHGMDDLYYDLELPLSLVLAAMEKQGIRLDLEELRAYGKELSVKIEELIRTIYAQAGTEFNLNSPRQLGEVLFEKLGLPTIKKTKTGYSTDAEVLEKLAPYHEVVGSLLHYRMLAKLQSTYVEGLQKEIRADTGKIHTYYRQTIAATGRLSSQFPNLQNIPIRTEEGRKLRKMFIPSKPGWLIMAADYSQIELRVLAHISGDLRMKEAFLADLDIHTKTAMDIFGVQASQVDAAMRRQAKAVNFGIVYGISDYGLSQNLQITRKEAATFIEQYFSIFTGVRTYMDEIVKQARDDGFVTTLLHRRRYLPDIKASNFNVRSFAERMAMNTPIQGTAADIIKLAMVQMAKRMREAALTSRLLLQVHDELVFEIPASEQEIMSTLVRDTMENALKLDVPLKVDVSSGANWYEAK